MTGALLLLIPVFSYGQDRVLLDRFCRGVSQSCMEMSYTYSARVSGVLNQGEGVLHSQGLMWKVKGNGVDMYCDSASVWIVDAASKEVVIEPAAAEEPSQLLSNPALIFSRVDEMFVVNETLVSSDGKAVMYVLNPKESDDIDWLNLEIFKSDATVRRASVAFEDGTLIKIEVSSMKLTPKVSLEAFRPQTDFDSSWIVTDLR